MGVDGNTYLYNNPLTCRGGVTRKPWYSVPCCPSNLSRTWADLGKYIFSSNKGELIFHQYVGSELKNQVILLGDGSEFAISLKMDSALPYGGLIKIKIFSISTHAQNLTVPFTIRMRQPSWAGRMQLTINRRLENPYADSPVHKLDKTASGYDPRVASFYVLQRNWVVGDEVRIEFEMPLHKRRAHPKVKGHRRKVAITRGPLVYCLESVDNPDVDIFNVKVDIASLKPVTAQTEFGEIVKILGRSKNGQLLTFIPYFLWGNRGESQMTVWVNE
jgi:DUF1680 family protein